jgi:hypothetical protein
MKKLAIAFATLSVFAITSCHYGQNEAKETLERNEQYKSEKADYSVNRAGSEASKEEAPATPAVADTTAHK